MAIPKKEKVATERDNNERELMIKKIIRFIVAFAGASLVYAVMLYLLQDRLLFVPDRFYISPTEAGLSMFKENPIKTTDGRYIMSWYAKGKEDKPLILFFHGNAWQVAFFAPDLKPYIESGYSILMPEYRGFAGSAGHLGEKEMYADAEMWFDYAKKDLEHNEIIVMGYSMGTAPASRLAALRSPAAVVLMAPFYSLLREVEDKHIPLAPQLLTRRLESYKYISAYTGKLLVIHGKKDRLISFRQGRDLFDLAPSGQKMFHLFGDANHHTLYFNNKYHQFVLQWLDNLPLGK